MNPLPRFIFHFRKRETAYNNRSLYSTLQNIYDLYKIFSIKYNNTIKSYYAKSAVREKKGLS